MRSRTLLCTLLSSLLTLPLLAQTAQQPSSSKSADAQELVKQGEKLAGEGKSDEAMAMFQRALEADPSDYKANLLLGAALDLQGKYTEARQHLAKAIDLVPEAQVAQPLRVMAVSYAFECNTEKAAEYERRAFDLQYKWNKLADAAGTADELARIYLECGDFDNAFQWYQTGHLTALKDKNIKPEDKQLWEFRWEAALARIAARRGQADKAKEHLAAAKAVLDKMNNPDQMRFYPYLAGYVALYAGDYKAAIADLSQIQQKDPFMLSLLAQAYEKAGNKAQAIDAYKTLLTYNTHNPVNAFARPLARKKLAELDPASAAKAQ